MYWSNELLDYHFISTLQKGSIGYSCYLVNWLPGTTGALKTPLYTPGTIGQNKFTATYFASIVLAKQNLETGDKYKFV